MITKEQIKDKLLETGKSGMELSKMIPLTQPTIDKAKRGEMSVKSQYILTKWIEGGCK